MFNRSCICFPEPEPEFNKPFSVIDIVAKRRLIIHKAKVQIGSMASNFIEAPEERTQVLEKLVKLVSEDISELKHFSLAVCKHT